jgi:hypothetical protein
LRGYGKELAGEAVVVVVVVVVVVDGGMMAEVGEG